MMLMLHLQNDNSFVNFIYVLLKQFENSFEKNMVFQNFPTLNKALYSQFMAYIFYTN